jgi:hypothetical protein
VSRSLPAENAKIEYDAPEAVHDIPEAGESEKRARLAE